MHSLHAFFLQFFVFHDISKPAYLPKSWISPKITNTVLLGVIHKAKEHGVNMLNLPSHTSHSLQPLNEMWFKPFKSPFKSYRNK